MSLTKDDIVKVLVREAGCQLNQSVEMIETLMELIKSILASGDDVLISGLVNSASRRSVRERAGIRQPAGI